MHCNGALVRDPDGNKIEAVSFAAQCTARSAYRLRARSPAFAAAWDTADHLAVGRLSALAFDRTIHGRTEQVWHEGVLVAEKRVPSDRLLMWLLARLYPRRFAARWELRKTRSRMPSRNSPMVSANIRTFRAGGAQGSGAPVASGHADGWPDRDGPTSDRYGPDIIRHAC